MMTRMVGGLCWCWCGCCGCCCCCGRGCGCGGCCAATGRLAITPAATNARSAAHRFRIIFMEDLLTSRFGMGKVKAYPHRLCCFLELHHGRPVGRPLKPCRTCLRWLAARLPSVCSFYLLDDLAEVITLRSLQRRELLVAQQVLEP